MRKEYKILPTKIELANLIRKNVVPVKFVQNEKDTSWWKGYYDIDDYPLFIHFRYFVNRNEVNYVDIMHRIDGTFKPVSPTKIKTLLETVKNYENKKN